MDYQGYKITKDTDGTWRAAVGDKVVVVGCSTKEVAQEHVDGRRRLRTVKGLEPAG